MFGFVEVAGKKNDAPRSDACVIAPAWMSADTGNAKSRKKSLLPSERLRASVTCMLPEPVWYGVEKSCVSEGSWKMGVKSMTCAVAGSLRQISIVSSLPFSDSWYWYLKWSPLGTCMSDVHTCWAKPPPLPGFPSIR